MRQLGPGRPVDGGAAIGAAVLAGCIGLWCAAIAYDDATRDYPELQGGEIFPSAPFFVVAAIAWLLGSGLLFGRTAIGRVLVIIDAVFGLMYFAVKGLAEESVWGLAPAVLPLLALVLAASKPTERWIAAKPRRATESP